MRLHSYKTCGIIIKRINTGEADKIITLITPEYGKLRCVAKGIRHLHSRKAPALELFSLSQLFLVKGKNLDIVTEVKLIESFRNLRQSLDRVKLAYQFCELINLMTVEAQGQEEVFELFKKALKWLDETRQLSLEGLRRFQLCLLRELGFGVPTQQDLDNLTLYIENIIDKRLVTKNHFKL
ncbi:DNA repair protein RecO [Candidatus Beckwithbacteria bacterium RBG_13_42_9]|uniref:DNA repair protein RecO n=1 Tax=Candidatus Beckwithbacteria bacterium RBG_13_42_9 TaxID=1797457 RepID=A0A1F5E7C5_9BACT|nr:MAG: DNA repair protein RecO [Candidatus Beckwithbacteria bacterium RBG_13_42_9]